MTAASEDVAGLLREPRNKREELLRGLAEAAMSVTNHDAAEHEPGYIHEVRAMERKFSLLLRGKLRAHLQARASTSDQGE